MEQEHSEISATYVVRPPYCGLVKVDFSEFREIRPTWGVFFRPIVVRPPNIYRRNERIRISAFQRMSARPKRIRIVEVTIGTAISKIRKNKNLADSSLWQLVSCVADC